MLQWYAYVTSVDSTQHICFISILSERQRASQRHLPSAPSLPKYPLQPGLGKAKDRGLENNLSLPHDCWGLNYSAIICCLPRYKLAESWITSQHSNLSTTTWHAGVSGGTLTCCNTMSTTYFLIIFFFLDSFRFSLPSFTFTFLRRRERREGREGKRGRGEGGREIVQGGIIHLLMQMLTPQMAANGQGCAMTKSDDRNQDLHVSLPHGWQGPKHLGHLAIIFPGN